LCECDAVRQVFVIDHHATAEKELTTPFEEGDCVKKLFIVFDKKKSGAMLTWEHLFPSEKVPALIEYVQDRDLWQWKLQESKEYSAGLRAYPREFEVWAEIEQTTPGIICAEGKAVLRFQTEQVKVIADNAWLGELDGHIIPVVNTNSFISEVGEYLVHQTGCKFSASYYDTPEGKRRWSLRSRSDFDVSVIAKNHGGGGHKQASGFESDIHWNIKSCGRYKEAVKNQQNPLAMKFTV
jgi:uncharacterized protein